jgi:HTH-type transcriptional regulator/antitoxin HigA
MLLYSLTMAPVTQKSNESRPDHPGKVLRQLLAARGWTVEHCADVMGFARQHVSGLLSGKVGVTPEMAVALSATFGNEPADWLRWNAEHQLSLVQVDRADVQRRVELFNQAPIREMQRRGWITTTDDTETIESDLQRFLADADGVFAVATLRRDASEPLSASERAWCLKARQMAIKMPFVAPFNEKRLATAERKLRQVAAYEQEASRVAELLAYFGIRFVIVEPLPGAKIDGAAFWIGDSPVIAVSLRLDRIDAFWFTVFHEFMHIKYGDAYSVDVGLVDEGEHGLTIATANSEAEDRANKEAAGALVPQHDLETFIATTRPRYSATAIVQFAHLIKMHPGVIVGQLQHRGELSYSSHRGFLVRVRRMVTDHAATDGWGHPPVVN